MASEQAGAVPPARSVLDKALAEVNNGSPQAAIAMLKTYKPPMGEFADYNYVYAKALRRANRLYDSLEAYRLAYLYFPGGRQKELSLLERAEVYEDLGFYQEAASVFRIFLNTFKKSEFSERAHLGLANALFNTVHYRQALANYEQAGSSPEAMYGRAEALFATGKTREAYDLFKSLGVGGLSEKDLQEGKNQKSPAATALARYSMGEACRLLGKTDEAKALLGSIREGEYSHRASFLLGLIAAKEGSLREAASLFRDASGSSRSGLRYKALIDLAQCDLELDRTGRAIGLLKRVTQNLFGGKLRNDAFMLLAKAEAKDGNSIEAAEILKDLMMKKDYALQAADEMQKIIEDAMDNSAAVFPALWKVAGMSLTQPARAAFIFKAAGMLEASDIDQSAALYSWLVRNGSPRLKMEAARKLMGYYVARGKAREAAGLLRIARLAGHDDPTLRLKAGLYFLLGNYAVAQRALLSIKALSQQDLLLLAGTIGQTRDINAVRLVEKRMSKSNMDVPAALYLSMADASYAKGLKKQALQLYKQAYAGRAASGGHAGLDAADLKWTLYRMQSLEKDPQTALDSLQNDGGLMARYAAARLLESEVSKGR